MWTKCTPWMMPNFCLFIVVTFHLVFLNGHNYPLAISKVLCVICSCQISRVSDQNGVCLLYIMLEIHHSGREPSICFCMYICICDVLWINVMGDFLISQCVICSCQICFCVYICICDVLWIYGMGDFLISQLYWKDIFIVYSMHTAMCLISWIWLFQGVIVRNI